MHFLCWLSIYLSHNDNEVIRGDFRLSDIDISIKGGELRMLLVIGWRLLVLEYIEGELVDGSNEVESEIITFLKIKFKHHIVLVFIH